MRWLLVMVSVLFVACVGGDSGETPGDERSYDELLASTISLYCIDHSSRMSTNEQACRTEIEAHLNGVATVEGGPSKEQVLAYMLDEMDPADYPPGSHLSLMHAVYDAAMRVTAQE